MLAASRTEILSRLKTIMRRDLKLGADIQIPDDIAFFGGDADIDSLDVLMLMTSVEKEFGLKIASEEVGRNIFVSLATLTDYLAGRNAGEPAGVRDASGAAVGGLLNNLPHQPPFRFVSKLINVVEGQSAQGVWTVLGNEAFFAGHFPGRPIVPGVLIAEALAQVSGLAKFVPGAEGRLAQVDVRFDSAVAPPAEIELSSRVTNTVGSLIQYEVKAIYKANVVARGTIALSWQSRS